MKQPTFLPSLALSAIALTGLSSAAEIRQTSFSTAGEAHWFAGASAAYLFDAGEPMFSLSLGRRLDWSPSGWEVDLYLEGGRIEDDNQFGIALDSPLLESDVQIVPITGNLRFGKRFTPNFGAYCGLGAGAAFTEIITDHADRDQDVVFTGQLFAGLNWYLGQTSELFVGGRWIYFSDAEKHEMKSDGAVELGYRWHF